MSLIKATGTIGGLTLVSRIAGFARDMLLSRILGAGLAADAFFVAFRLPNLFRRLFAEGAFSAAFVPMFSHRLHGEGGEAHAERFSQDVLSIFVPILILFTALFEIIMPGFVWLMAAGFRDEPGKFELTVDLTRIAFPYLFFISLVSLLTGILNSMARFAAGAAAPIFFNLTLIAGILIGWQLRDGIPGVAGDVIVAQSVAAAITVSGLVQLIWLWYWLRKTGFRLTMRRPRATPEVRELGRIFLPATFGAGIYQMSLFVETFFATQLPQGSMAYLNYADRLNQMPLGVIGIALGTAILPTLSRFISTGDAKGAARIQSNAIELAMLLTLPAAVALAICAEPFVTAFYVGGRFNAEDAAITAGVVTALVTGLPAYVLVKVLIPNFFSRKDTRTPVYTAAIVLVANVALNFVVISRFGIVGLAFVTASCAWLNTALLYSILHRRGLYAIERKLWGRLGRQLVSTGLMAVALVGLRGLLADYFAGSVIERIVAIGTLVTAGMIVYFGTAYMIGAIDRERVNMLKRRKAPN